MACLQYCETIPHCNTLQHTATHTATHTHKYIVNVYIYEHIDMSDGVSAVLCDYNTPQHILQHILQHTHTHIL
jgi:hypothetical protein